MDLESVADTLELHSSESLSDSNGLERLYYKPKSVFCHPASCTGGTVILVVRAIGAQL